MTQSQRSIKYDYRDDLMIQKNLKFFVLMIYLLFLDEDNPYQEVLFTGHERKLFTFDLALFLFVDYFAQNYVLAAFITYIVQKVNIFRTFYFFQYDTSVALFAKGDIFRHIQF